MIETQLLYTSEFFRFSFIYNINYSRCINFFIKPKDSISMS